MWISILNYNMGQIEVADVTEDFAENKTATDDNERATDWLESNDYCPDEVAYMLTDEAPELYNGNTQTIIDIQL